MKTAEKGLMPPRTGQEIKDLAAILASYPAPDKWTQTQKNQAVHFAALLNTAQKMIAAANLAGVDYEGEKAAFLANAGKSDSNHTRRAYGAALGRLEAFAAKINTDTLELSPAQADDFIYSLRGRSASSVRLDAAACSSFFTFLERRHTNIKNPFRGTKARPGKRAARKTEIPNAFEVDIILKTLPPWEAAAATIMARRGLRAGALPGMSILGPRFETRSKGRDISGELPPEALEAVKAAGLDRRAPFAGTLPNTLEHKVARAIKKIYQTRKILTAYSCHDLRHFYAAEEYRKNRDIHRLSKLLGHASIQVTETYLRGLGQSEK